LNFNQVFNTVSHISTLDC